MQGIRRMFDVLFVLLGITVTAFAQDEHLMHSQGIQLFDHYTNLHQSNQLNDTVYLLKTDSVATSLINQGVFFSVNQMVDNLTHFEEIAWGNDNYRNYRQMYYFILLNNAYMSELWGASMYYAEKATKESIKNNTPRPFVELSVKIHVNALNGRHEKVIEIYEEQKSYFDNLLAKVKAKPEDYYLESLDALRLLGGVINAYATQRDTTKVEESFQLAKAVAKNARSAPSISNNNKFSVSFSSLSFDFFREAFYQNFDQAQDILNKIAALKKKKIGQSSSYTDYSYLEWKTSLYIEMKQADSAAYYLSKYEQLPNFAKSQKTLIKRYKAKLEMLNGNPEVAYGLMSEALDESFTVQKQISEEVDNLLYAQTEAEHHRLAFLKSEKEKKEKNFIIITVSVCALLVIAIIYTLFRLKDIKLKRVVRNLNEVADIQIALMEQFESKVRKEEQQRISQDLHDDLASTLVAIKNNIDITISETLDETEREGLSKLNTMLESAFDYVRNKSHEIFEKAQMPDEEMFQQHILHLVQVAFPSPYYTLNVKIDDYALKSTSIELRSELIRIIQEAFTNIIKHAKATKVDLLIYKEENLLYIVIKDNGVGLNEKKQTKQYGLGLQSIQKRLDKFKAKFSFSSSNDEGAEMVITIPTERL